MNKSQKKAAAIPIKGADIFVKCLERAGTDVIFAYPGGASMELHQSLIDSSIRVILPRHEQGGGFAAAGYARATGKTGVCMATSGPGATNLVTAIADAYLDSVPMLVITGQVPQQYIGKNAFQEIDIIGVTRPICKHSFLVLSVDELPEVFAEAFHIANSGRPGPVVIDLPKDVQQAMAVPDFTTLPVLRGYSVETELDMDGIKMLKAAIEKAERPCLYVGGGVIIAEAAEELKTFAETYNIPVVTTLMGIGAFPEKHPLSLKWLGMHGTYYANYAANESDLLIALGARFDDRVTGGNTETFAPGATIAHVDIDASEINKNKVADIPVINNVKDVLIEMNKAPIYKDYAAWHERIRQWKKDVPLSYDQKEHILPQYVVEKISDLTEGKAIVCPGVGQHQMWAAQFYTYERPRQHLSSGGLGTMGFGLPTAMGAKVACPDDIVVNIDGDGSFQMNIQELGTLHTENIGVKMVVLNNQHLGMVAQWEDRFYGSRRGNTVLKNDYVTAPYPDFVAIAAGYSIPGRHVWKPEEVEPAIREMLATDGPFILDVHIEYQDHVLPMIPSGKSYKEIMVK